MRVISTPVRLATWWYRRRGGLERLDLVSGETVVEQVREAGEGQLLARHV